MINYTNITKYHEKGYKGQNINILNVEDKFTEHSQLVCACITAIAPSAKLFHGTLGHRNKNGVVSNVVINTENGPFDFIEFIKTNNIKIINASLAQENPSAKFNDWIRENVIDKLGIIIVNAAGNDRVVVSGIYKYCAIVVGAGGIFNGKFQRHYYSGQGDEVDFLTFIPDEYNSGTSLSSPCLAGQIALLLNKYGDLNQYQVYNILKNSCEDLGQAGKDISYGWGLPILPLEEVRVMFKDVEETRWSKEAIDWCAKNSILKGFPDGTFRPGEPLTREQYAVLKYREYLEKEGK